MNLAFQRLLGLAMRAGKLKLGEGRTEESLQRGSAGLVLVASDAADNTRKKFQDKCAYYHKPLVVPADRYALGACLGKEFAVVISVEDTNFAKRLYELSQADMTDE